MFALQQESQPLLDRVAVQRDPGGPQVRDEQARALVAGLRVRTQDIPWRSPGQPQARAARAAVELEVRRSVRPALTAACGERTDPGQDREALGEPLEALAVVAVLVREHGGHAAQLGPCQQRTERRRPDPRAVARTRVEDQRRSRRTAQDHAGAVADVERVEHPLGRSGGPRQEHDAPQRQADPRGPRLRAMPRPAPGAQRRRRREHGKRPRREHAGRPREPVGPLQHRRQRVGGDIEARGRNEVGHEHREPAGDQHPGDQWGRRGGERDADRRPLAEGAPHDRQGRQHRRDRRAERAADRAAGGGSERAPRAGGGQLGEPLFEAQRSGERPGQRHEPERRQVRKQQRDAEERAHIERRLDQQPEAKQRQCVDAPWRSAAALAQRRRERERQRHGSAPHRRLSAGQRGEQCQDRRNDQRQHPAFAAPAEAEQRSEQHGGEQADVHAADGEHVLQSGAGERAAEFGVELRRVAVEQRTRELPGAALREDLATPLDPGAHVAHPGHSGVPGRRVTQAPDLVGPRAPDHQFGAGSERARRRLWTARLAPRGVDRIDAHPGAGLDRSAGQFEPRRGARGVLDTSEDSAVGRPLRLPTALEARCSTRAFGGRCALERRPSRETGERCEQQRSAPGGPLARRQLAFERSGAEPRSAG